MTEKPTYLLKEDVSYSIMPSGIAFRSDAAGLVLIEDIPDSLRRGLIKVLKKPQLGITPNDIIFPIFEFLYAKHIVYIKPEKYSDRQQRTAYWIANLTGCYEDQKKRLNESLILILGVGGLGSVISLQLAQSGIKRFTLIDQADLNIEDLNRQAIYSKSDLKRRKVDILKEKLEQEYEGVRVSAINKKIIAQPSSISFIEKLDPCLVFLCADEPPSISVDLIKASLKSSIPFVCGAVGLCSGVISRVLNCENSKDDFLREYNSERVPLVSSLSMTNSIVASHMALVGYKYILQGEVGQTQYINFNYNMSEISQGEK